MAAHLPNPIAGNSNTTSFHGTAEWPSAPFSIPSITFDGWSLHIRSYTPAYLSTPQMHALATICVDQIQRYMRFARDGVPWPEQTTIFRPTRRDSHSSYLENVEVMFENREGGQGVLLTVEAVVKTLIIIVNMVVAPSWSEMERMICHDFVGHPVRVESGGGTSPLEIFRQVKLRERTDRGAEG
ncbi:MAG: hypothetical protein LQ352_001506 [Teloschistes flavicans]|nr:MAG: hypothetical protein LQ352_001506 [Teloschistes flavicans]